MLAFGNIEAERSRNGLSKTELAKLLGVSTTTYKRYITGASCIPSDKVIKLATELGCTADYLLGLSNEKDAS